MPPYLPMDCSGLMTSGSCPIRSATGGSLPALTNAASCGASLKVLGCFAGSVTTSGPSSFPIRPLLVAWASAPAATTQMSAPARRVIVSRDRSVPVRSLCQSVVMKRPPCSDEPAREVRRSCQTLGEPSNGSGAACPTALGFSRPFPGLAAAGRGAALPACVPPRHLLARREPHAAEAAHVGHEVLQEIDARGPPAHEGMAGQDEAAVLGVH